MTLNVKMIPNPAQVQRGESGIITIIRKYNEHFPKYDMRIVSGDDFDIFAVHAGMMESPYPAYVPTVSHIHGVYWTAMYKSSPWEWKANADVIKAMRHAHTITAPSSWVAETIQRDMHRSPTIIPHGVDWKEWQHDDSNGGYVIGYAKNRAGQDVCNPDYLPFLAEVFPNIKFLSTFSPNKPMPNIEVTGVLPYNQMKTIVQRADCFVSCTRETFGIAILEAMAAGLPILGWKEAGILDLVQHGINGYLAEPDNYPDLFQGLDYCLKNREMLGKNGCELAKEWTWDKVCKKLSEVYEATIKKARQPANCSIIIPSYNYSNYIGSAIHSAQSQTYPLLKNIIVVDDCSPDEGATERVVKEYSESDSRVKYVRLDRNSGVATARNIGISLTDTKYICCLDADDQLLPRYLEACIKPLEENQSLGMSFTSMEAILPDGRKFETKWPPDVPLFDQQIKGKNQVPTASVFRREAWECLGGYRPRYAPEGCGSEDAEFWLRMGANGWGAIKATQARMFIYSLGGNTTGRRDYEEPNWLEMHPWCKDGEHPLASLATSRSGSHPARSYDRPAISVVIPIGPGHEHDVINAMDSLEAQDFRMWEAILVLDGIDIEKFSPVLKSFPYAKVFSTGSKPKGAGVARNLGATKARSGLLCFLDSDDYLLPEALTSMLHEYSKGEAIVYGDCRAHAVVEDISKLSPRMRQNIISYDKKKHNAVIRFPASNYNCELAQSMPNSDDPDSLYLVAHITCLIPKAWHDSIGGFDESMVSWEDVDWHWRLSRAGYCYRRINQDVFVYQFSSGGRREIGRQNWQSLLQYIRTKYERIPNMPCRSCGGHSSPPPVKQIIGGRTAQMPLESDDSYVKCEYVHPNKGQHQVTGAATGTRYGQRAGGEIFLVHKDDVRAQPMLFKPLNLEVPVHQEETQPPPPPPVVVGEAKTESIPHDLISELDQAEEEPIGLLEKTDLSLIPGVTPAIAKQMMQKGIDTPQAIMDSGIEGLQELKGVGPNRAATIVQWAAKKSGLT